MDEADLLTQWIYGAQGPPPGADRARLEAWSRALQEWLQPPGAYAQIRQAQIAGFFQSLGKPPWEASTSEVDAWLEAGRQAGLSVPWLRNQRDCLAKFYAHALARDPGPSDPGPELPANPVLAAQKFPINHAERTNYLDEAEAGALLRAIEAETSLLGKRDYALFLTLLHTGRDYQQVRQLRWRDVHIYQPFVICIQWPRTPDSEALPLAPDAANALLMFQIASGRLAAIQPDWALFPPLGILNSQPLVGSPEVWRNDQPVSVRELYHRLRHYAAWAGLDPGLHFRTLRNTAILWMAEAGLSRAAMAEMLGVKSAQTATAYLCNIRRSAKQPLWSEAGPEPHTPHGYGKYWGTAGKNPNLKHGFFAHELPDEWIRELLKMAPALRQVPPERDPLSWKLGIARLLAGKHLQRMDQAESPDEAFRMMEYLLRQVHRIIRIFEQRDVTYPPAPPCREGSLATQDVALKSLPWREGMATKYVA